MRLYVWHNSLRDYTAGVMFALASSEEEARALVLEDCPHAEYDIHEDPTAYDSPVGFAVWGGG